ncbi:MAG: TIGR01777 family oxidoreductase [bacterium]
MNVIIVGGTGLIGSALHKSLADQDHHVTIISRFPDKATPELPADAQVLGAISQVSEDHTVDAVVNLAGAQIVGKRWTRARKQLIWESRVDLTRNIVRWLEKREQKPQVLVSGSAIGFYGNCGELNIDEKQGPGQDFGARLCVAWEAEALKAEQFGIRVCLARTGLVLSTRGGILQQMMPPFRLGFGAKISQGLQWMSWIHINDQIAALERLIKDRELNGAFNLTAPEAVCNKEFSHALARVLKKPCFFTIPGQAIRMVLGEAAELLLGGQHVSPKRLLDHEFYFQHPTIEQALQDLLQQHR